MNNRKTRVYVNGTSALKIQHRDDSQGNVVCLGRSGDGRLFVDAKQASSRRSAAVQPRNEVSGVERASLRDDLGVAYRALGLKGMEQNLMRGTAAGKAIPGIDRARGLLFGAAMFFATLAVVLA